VDGAASEVQGEELDGEVRGAAEARREELRVRVCDSARGEETSMRPWTAAASAAAVRRWRGTRGASEPACGWGWILLLCCILVDMIFRFRLKYFWFASGIKISLTYKVKSLLLGITCFTLGLWSFWFCCKASSNGRRYR